MNEFNQKTFESLEQYFIARIDKEQPEVDEKLKPNSKITLRRLAMGNMKFKITFTTTDSMKRILGLLENLDAVFELHIEPDTTLLEGSTDEG